MHCKLVRAQATEAMQCRAREEQVKTCMREKKSHMTRSNIASYAWAPLAQCSKKVSFLARVAREMFCALQELETPTLGSRATLCADLTYCLPLPRQRSMGTCRSYDARGVAQETVHMQAMQRCLSFSERMRQRGYCACFSSSGQAASWGCRVMVPLAEARLEREMRSRSCSRC